MVYNKGKYSKTRYDLPTGLNIPSNEKKEDNLTDKVKQNIIQDLNAKKDVSNSDTTSGDSL